MRATRQPVPQPAPPDEVTLTMTVEQAELLREVSYFTVTVPLALREAGSTAPEREVRATLREMYEELCGVT